MAVIQRSAGAGLRKTFDIAAVLLVLGLLWLAFIEAGSSSYKSGQDFMGPSGGAVASTGIGFQPADSTILASLPTLGAANDALLLGSGDKIVVLALAAASPSAQPPPGIALESIRQYSSTRQHTPTQVSATTIRWSLRTRARS